MLSDLAQIRQALGEATFSAGERLAQAGRVAQTRELQSGAVVTGIVTEGASHRVYIQLVGGKIEGECSCELGENCVHVAALLIEVKGKANPQRQAPASAIPRPDSAPASWAPAARQQCLLYRLEMQPLATTGIHRSIRVRLSVWVGQPTAQGQWQSIPFVPRRARADQYPRYVQPADEAILSLLTGLAAEGPYPLQGETGGRLLRACIATGRAYWGEIRGAQCRRPRPSLPRLRGVSMIMGRNN